MGSKAKDSNQIVIMAPLSGKIVALEQVPDPVFSEKALGDGIAILPEDGKIYSPVNGEIASVAATKHAYGFQSEDGVDVLVHVGLETVGLQGEGFTVHKQEGDKVKIGDLVAEADLEFIKNKGLNLVTPVLLCDGVDELQMEAAAGKRLARTPCFSFLLRAQKVPKPKTALLEERLVPLPEAVPKERQLPLPETVPKERQAREPLPSQRRRKS